MSVFKQFNFPGPLFKKCCQFYPGVTAQVNLKLAIVLDPIILSSVVMDGVLYAPSVSALTVAVTIDFSFIRTFANI